MRNLLLFLHIAGTIFWMGGMAFMVMALRPALHAQQEPPQQHPRSEIRQGGHRLGQVRRPALGHGDLRRLIALRRPDDPPARPNR